MRSGSPCIRPQQFNWLDSGSAKPRPEGGDEKKGIKNSQY
jgi:hypothetical protein